MISVALWTALVAATPPKVVLLPARRSVVSQEVARVDTSLTDAVKGAARVELIGGDGLREAIEAHPLYGERVALARELVGQGTDDYERMRLADALKYLTRALGMFYETHHQLLHPQEVANAQLTLALTHIERGEKSQAHLAMKRFIRLDPLRRLQAGFFAPAVLSAFEVALADVQEESDGDPPLAELLGLGRRLGARWLVSAYVGGRARGSDALVVSLYDVRRRKRLDRESVPMDHPQLDVALHWLMSRLLCCVTHQRAPRPKQRLSASVGLRPGGEVYLQRPVREAFVNLGLSLSMEWGVTDHLVGLGSIGVHTTSPWRLTAADYEDLRDPQDVAALFLGVGPSWQREHARTYAVFGVDGQWFGEVRTTKDAGCKWGPPYACRPGVHTPRLALGPGVVLGHTARLFGPLLWNLQVGTALYIVSLENNQLNLPLRVRAGLAHRF